MFILILEDNSDRVKEMKISLGHEFEFHIERRADLFIKYLKANLDKVKLISLDHDLDKEFMDELDPGDGRDVVKWLCENIIKIPVIIHTSNSIMGDSMYYNLMDNGNKVERIDPYDGVEWIKKSWIKKVIKLSNHINSAQQGDAPETGSSE